MSIFTLPVYESDAEPQNRTALSDEELYARLAPPKTIVVRFGYQKLVGEFVHDGDAKPGCGSKLVARTPRGTEVVEMLTTTCSNSGCSKSVTRQEMLDYIENSGGRDYPFQTNGRILRVATIEDLNQQAALDAIRKEAIVFCKAQVAELQLPMKLVDVEPILGGELLTFYYMSENRVDFRELVQRLSAQFKTRIEMRQVGARDEARLVADYERCGQYCCCKNFLKVLKPVSMRSAKVQKATLDPLKISGRCGRLMCCLRYEDQTYKELKARLPHRNTRVGTSEGPGVVVDGKILVQLVLVRLDHDQKEIAVPVEELMDPETCPKPGESRRQRELAAEFESDPLRGLSSERIEEKLNGGPRKRPEGGAESEHKDAPHSKRRRDRNKSSEQRQQEYRQRSQKSDKTLPTLGEAPTQPLSASGPDAAVPQGDGPRKKRRRRRRRGGRGPGSPNQGGGPSPEAAPQ
jgi:cell fate regulator YaaT (PSP1 superfamily)